MKITLRIALFLSYLICITPLHAATPLDNAVQAYRFWYPTVSAEAIFEGNRKIGIKDNEGLVALSAKPYHVGFTLNSDTPYGGGVIDLSKGPMVIDIPKGPYIALVNDHHQQWVIDMGIPGPDKGLGARYLILPPDYKGALPSGYRIARSSSYKAFVAIRVLPLNGDIDKAMAALRNVKIYSLASKEHPKLLNFVDANNINMDSTPLDIETSLTYWKVLHQIINDEPPVKQFQKMYELLATLGIEKGKPFTPDEHMKKTLEEAAKLGHAQLMKEAFASDRPDRMAWKDRKWEWVGLVPNNPDFKTKKGLDTEARERWFAQAIVASPAMFRRHVGSGSLYWLGVRDNHGMYLDGGKSYKLTIPLPVPAKLFWSITVYSQATRSEVQTDQNRAALRSLFELKDLGDATSVDLYFGPTTPKGKEDYWIKTNAGEEWFAYLRIYGPEKEAFNTKWKPGDFVEIK